MMNNRQYINLYIGFNNFYLPTQFKLMSSNEEQVRRLQQRLNFLPVSNPQVANKIKLTNLQQLVRKINISYVEESQLTDLKIRDSLELVKKFQIKCREQKQENERKQQLLKLKLARAQKISQRAIQKMVKERKDSQKKINTALEGYLLELTSAKAKGNFSCKYAVKQFSNLELQIKALQSEIKEEQDATKEITKKIYAQFSSQIEELSEMLAEQKKEKQMEQQKILSRLQKMYLKNHQVIRDGCKQRENHEQQVVNFLEKLIEKVRYELTHQ